MKRLVSAFLAGAMALSLAACGGSASTSTAASSAAASAAPASSVAADSDLAYIQSNGKMVIGYTVYEPMNYTDADGNFTGLADAVADGTLAVANDNQSSKLHDAAALDSLGNAVDRHNW